MTRYTTYTTSITVDGKAQCCAALGAFGIDAQHDHVFGHTCTTYTTLTTSCDGGVRVWHYCAAAVAQGALIRHCERIDEQNAVEVERLEALEARRAHRLSTFTKQSSERCVCGYTASSTSDFAEHFDGHVELYGRQS